MEFETLLQILITATVQGITEFLPISSSGHLFFINKIFSWEDINLKFYDICTSWHFISCNFIF